jgi:signal transduction histidine kinase
MQLRDWFRPPRHVLTIFLGVAVVCGVALGWLGWLLLEQDNAVESQRRRERLDQSADIAIAEMQRALSDLEAQLTRPGIATAPPQGLTFVFTSANGGVVRAQPALLYYPEQPRLQEAPPGTFAEAERLEYAANDLAGAAKIYEKLLAAANPAIRAGALTRLARIHRKRHDPASAQSSYDRLAQIAQASVAGLPAGLISREGLASMFQEMHRNADLLREASSLQSDLHSGRWQLTKQQYAFYTSETAAWLGKPYSEDTDAVARAEALDWLWSHNMSAERVSRRLIEVGPSPALVVWNQSADGLHAALAGPRYLAALCKNAVHGDNLQWALADLEGRSVLGQLPPSRDSIVRTASATGLPWTLQLFAAGQPVDGPSPRRQLLLWVFAVLAIVLSTGAFVILHAISRELRVSRLQSDFVAAVSHEFRTPLSSLAQISEMLARDRFPSDELRSKSYDVLVRETERLRRLVEGLLDFGRFEAGAAAYRFETIEVAGFLRSVVAEFQERVALQGYAIELTAPDAGLPVRADREALGRAIWNLLDNAVKYSPDCRMVWVDLEGQANRVSIAVRDRGLGIPVHEQREVFNNFVRGADSKERHIKGTGIGLAMVRHIVQAHGGEILLTSEPGQGSRFTMVLHSAEGVS